MLPPHDFLDIFTLSIGENALTIQWFLEKNTPETCGMRRFHTLRGSDVLMVPVPRGWCRVTPARCRGS